MLTKDSCLFDRNLVVPMSSRKYNAVSLVHVCCAVLLHVGPCVARGRSNWIRLRVGGFVLSVKSMCCMWISYLPLWMPQTKH